MTKTIDTILVATDFSACAENALQYAIHWALTIEARIVLVRVYTLPASTYDRPAQEAYEEKLAQLRSDYFHPNKIDFDFELRFHESAEEEIIKVAEEKSAALIIMGTRGAHGITALLGTTTTHLIRETTIPVLAVPEEAVFTGVQKIAFACDYKKLDDIAPVHFLRMLAEVFQARILIFNVNAEAKEMPIVEAIQVFRLDHYLEASPHSFEFADGADVEEALETFVKTHQVDVLTMIPQKHNLLERLFKGSLTNKMLYKTHIPILTFHP
mgnify:CR=1 FL=1